VRPEAGIKVTFDVLQPGDLPECGTCVPGSAVRDLRSGVWDLRSGAWDLRSGVRDLRVSRLSGHLRTQRGQDFWMFALVWVSRL